MVGVHAERAQLSGLSVQTATSGTVKMEQHVLAISEQSDLWNASVTLACQDRKLE